MALTTFEFYTEHFYGDMVDETSFPKWLSKAEIELMYLTNGNIDEVALLQYGSQIQMATCAVIDVLFQIDKLENGSLDGQGTVKSMSAGSESVSYEKATTKYDVALSSSQEREKLLMETVRRFLFGTGLLYQGVRLNG